MDVQGECHELLVLYLGSASATSTLLTRNPSSSNTRLRRQQEQIRRLECGIPAPERTIAEGSSSKRDLPWFNANLSAVEVLVDAPRKTKQPEAGTRCADDERVRKIKMTMKLQISSIRLKMKPELEDNDKDEYEDRTWKMKTMTPTTMNVCAVEMRRRQISTHVWVGTQKED
ncbi:hypothetical protein PIB30_022100 [Stylosanthes scabra]|uniref:Uncharacterized protein n=1 Tax=Stylosanthes scabra TaxID=79078 RepID=A0ABU6S8W5_9FABA|nr:hypothetical protein [Stylosanthes scabra]